MTSHDADGDTLTTSYQWTRNGTDISGQTGSTLNLATRATAISGDLDPGARDGQRRQPDQQPDDLEPGHGGQHRRRWRRSASPRLARHRSRPSRRPRRRPMRTRTRSRCTTCGRSTARRGSTTDTTALTDTLDLSVAGNGDAGETVSVEVTPNDGTVNGTLVSAQVTVAASTHTVYANDLFARASVNTWGSATTGGAYTLQGTAADYDMSGADRHDRCCPWLRQQPLGRARLRARSGRRPQLPRRSRQGAGRRVALVLRARPPHQRDQRVPLQVLRVAAGGGVYVQASSVVTNVEASIGTEVQVPGLTRSAGQFIWLRGQFEGANPTTMRMRAWADGSTEPSTWQYTATNAAAGLQVAGGVGVRTYLGRGEPTRPVLVTVRRPPRTSIRAPRTRRRWSTRRRSRPVARPRADVTANVTGHDAEGSAHDELPVDAQWHRHRGCRPARR